MKQYLLFVALFSVCIGASSIAGAAAPTDTAAQAPTALAVAIATARAQDMESLGRLTTEGEALYQGDSKKLTAYQYCSASSALSEVGEFRKAIREASKALFLGIKGGDEDVLAHAKRDFAIAYSYSGNLEKAEEYAEQSLRHRIAFRNRPAIFSRGNKVLGDIAMRRNQPEKAIVFYQKSVDAADDDLRFFARASLASAYVAAGQAEQAREMLAKAESYVGVVNDRSKAGAQASLLRLKANMALQQGKFDDALALFASAEAAIGKFGKSEAPYERFWVYEGVGRAKSASGDKAGALKAYMNAIAESEKIRARFRSEEIKTGLFGNMQYVFDEAVNLLMETGQAGAAWEISEQGRSRALLDMVRNRVTLTAGSNVFTDTLGKAVKPAEVAALLPERDVVIEFHVTDKKTQVWLLRAAGITAVTLPLERMQLALQVQEFRDSVSQRKASATQLGARLYDVLIKPLGLKPGENIVIVPHDALHYLPFQALRAGNAFLIEDFPVSYAPSASTLVAVMRHAVVKKGRLLALANPDLGNPDLALPGAQIEVQQIAALLPESDTYFQRDATKSRLLQGAGKSRLLHVAAHAKSDPVDPLFSHIYLAGFNGESGTLEAREVYGMDLKEAALVTLSACESGLGKVSQGDEIWGFTRSFLSAGSSAIIASLWEVADDSTEMLMTKFYRGMEKSDARQALRAAQIAVLKDPRFTHPFFWAPFNLIGDWR